MSERLRIAHVISVLDYGGVEAMALLLLKQLPPSEFEHHLIYIGLAPAQRQAEFSSHVVTFTHIPYRFRRCISFLVQISRRFKNLKIDAVLCHNYGQHPMIGFAAWWAGIRRVYSIIASSPCMSPLARWKNWVKGWLGRPWCKLEVAVSSLLAQELEAEIRLPPHRIRTIVNCCLTQEIGEIADRSRKSRTTTVPQLLMVARMDEAKDQDTLVLALAKLKEQGREFQLCLAGDGPRKAHLLELTERLGLQKCVLFHGARKDVPELLGTSDLFIFATKTEGFGLALIEAMSAEVPIISSDLPVCREILGNGSCGLLFQAGDVDALAKQIVYMLDHPDQAQQFAAAGRNRARSEYSPSFTVDRYAKLLRGELDDEGLKDHGNE